ncbi:putative PTS IIA-like nitrogen-regulatory protein PtsN [Coriobacterium glomerans PW2]|uniref:PTS IIA-like nitrogen-regulatory protein PtsN n=1 Tax=Coriobacterium glomerans (strain ATCC 49209 / DSM 20642 / JCM 10262 / PW2) TaxID=700015 RepID=F2NAK5_CORGP|nr:PTS sugar transporter subunit IIA [Coriobacterium glomerans]AEB06532.1 putative PTS IIA-like nitrogen-regulatory protein PtsN [Coriobacterium glomerans PW2]
MSDLASPRTEPVPTDPSKRDPAEVEWLYLHGTDFADQPDLFHGVSTYLLDHGYVRPGFEQALAKRERSFPTGLPTQPAVAIPHTDGEHVLREAIACIVNKRPIEFVEMCGEADDIVCPSVFFILVMREGKTHLDVLSSLIERIQQGGLVSRIMRAADEAELREVIASVW